MKSPRLLLVFVTLSCLAAWPSSAPAQSGTTLTPDRRTFLVSKDLGTERWTITVALATDDVDSVISATGNVFRPDGGPPSFVLCQLRNDSTGTLSDPASIFRLTCRGTDACSTTARACARDDWRPIADLVEIPASFFLPPGGLGALAGADRASPRSLAAWVTRATTWVTATLGLAADDAAQESSRGATLSLDRLTFLVSKDVGVQRWSIGLNLVPVATAGGGSATELLSVTGNVFFPDGQDPSFVYCTVREDSPGTLEDAASEFRFRCSGADACTSDATDCAADGWMPIADDIRLAASFFLPPGGLPPSVQTDPEIIVIGRTSDPPSIVTSEFSLEAGDAARIAGGPACAVGASCRTTRVGSCQDVSGLVVEYPGFGCGCQIDLVPPECIVCEGGASGACGEPGAYPVGSSGRMARGVCLPFSALTSDCIVYAVADGATEDGVGEACAGALGAPCSSESCCADDPRDGCALDGGGRSCPGVCVSSEGCAPDDASCGICVAEAPPACTANVDCDAGQFCSRALGACDDPGTCTSRPRACPAIFDPVCGCDGSTYGNACEAQAAGTSIASEGECGV